MQEDPRTDWRRTDFWLDRLAIALLIVALRAADFVVLLLRPSLFFAYLRLRLAEIGESPYATAEAARQGEGAETRGLTYGETPVVTALWLFRRAGVGRGSLVIDLGAGRGVPLLAARFLGAKARGVEMLEQHVDYAAGAMRWAGIDLRQGNASEAALDEATHVFLAWTCYSDALRAAIEVRLAQLRPGTVVISVDAAPRTPGLHLVEQLNGLESWGRAPVWIYRVAQQRNAEEEA